MKKSKEVTSLTIDISVEDLAMTTFDEKFKSHKSYLTNKNNFLPTYRQISVPTNTFTRYGIECGQARNVVTIAQMCKIYPEDKQCASVIQFVLQKIANVTSLLLTMT